MSMFSFCLTLYLYLHIRRPFNGNYYVLLFDNLVQMRTYIADVYFNFQSPSMKYECLDLFLVEDSRFVSSGSSVPTVCAFSLRDHRPILMKVRF